MEYKEHTDKDVVFSFKNTSQKAVINDVTSYKENSFKHIEMQQTRFVIGAYLLVKHLPVTNMAVLLRAEHSS